MLDGEADKTSRMARDSGDNDGKAVGWIPTRIPEPR